MRRSLILLWFLLVSTLLSSQAWATTYYVDRNLPGNDANNGTSEATPLLRVSFCVASKALVPGDTCLVKNGTYTEDIHMISSGTVGNPITVKNFPGHAPVIAFSSSSFTFNISGNPYPTTVSYITVEGLKIVGGRGVHYDSGESLIFRNLWLLDEFNGGGFSGAGHNITITQNRIEHGGNFATCSGSGTPNGCNIHHGMYLLGQDYVITNNIVSDNTAYGIQLDAAPFSAGSFGNPNQAGFTGLIANNTLAYQKYRGGIVLWHNGAALTNTTVENNICYENSQLVSGASQCIDYVGWTTSDTGVVVRNNLSFGTGTSTGFSNCSGSCTAGVGSTVTVSGTGNANPLFVNGPSTVPASPDFHLQPSSPAIDFGLNLTSLGITTDYAGSLRPQTGPWTAGAYVLSGPPPDALAPTNPSNLTVTVSNLFGRLNLSWTASTDNVAVLDYWVERCAGAGCASFFPVTSLAGTVLADTGLAPSTSYSYRVKARDTSSNFSGYSSAASAITAPVNFHLSLNLRRISTDPSWMLPQECLDILAQEPVAPKAPLSMTAGQWREFEYTWMKWCNRKLDAC